MGREAQAKVQRKLAKDSDKALKALLDRDKDGMKAVMTAREYMSKQDGKSDTKAKSDKKKKKADEVLTAQTNTTKKSFNPEMVKSLGFDPTLKPGQKRENPDSKMQEKVETSFSNSFISNFSTSLTDYRSCNLLAKPYH